ARQFALAWATTRKLSDPQKAADWAMLLGDVSWDVYGSRVPYGAFFGEAGNMIKNRAKPALGKGMYRYFESEAKLAESLAACARAERLAAVLNNPAITAETQVVTGYVKMLDLLYRMGTFITRATPPTDAERLGLQRDLLDFAQSGERVNAGLQAWAEACLPGKKVGGRLNDTMDVTDKTVATVSDSLASFGVRNPLQPYLRQRIGGWQDDDFEAQQRLTKTWDVTAYLQGAGEYRVDLVHERGWNGINGFSVALATAAGPGAQGAPPAALTVVVEDKHTSTIGYTPKEPVYVLKLPTYDAKLKYFIVADISGTKSSDKVPERRGCQGNANLWKVRQPDEKIELPPLLPMSDSEKARYGGPAFGKGGLRVGVMQGGYGSESILKHLRAASGVDAQPLWLISDKNLQNCQVLVVTQPRAGAAISDAAAKAMAKFVEKGGGLVATHDAVGYRTCPVVLPQVGKGVQHVREAQWVMPGEHALTAGFTAGAALRQSYYDAIVLEPGAGATVVGVAGADKAPIIVCGEAGKGRAVLCGLGLAFSANGDEDCTPTADEARLLDNMVRWCGRQ
ncbi:MAG: ThuA domain-containing protein, partial [Armatimonadetes bacterium]|nr:ThuA domain-containing protein [Armatimonadota bacterium]